MQYRHGAKDGVTNELQEKVLRDFMTPCCQEAEFLRVGSIWRLSPQIAGGF